MKKRVYIETTIPSFYYENRKEHDMIARRDWTRYWWDIQKDYYELVTSVAVIFEHIRHINTTLGLFVPILTTPVELFNVEGEIKYEKE